MSSFNIASTVLPAVVPLLLFLLFTYLHVQSRQPYFRAWQMAWAAYTLHFGLDAWAKSYGDNHTLAFVGSLLLVVMSLCILVSTRVTRRMTTSERKEALRPRWYELIAALALVVLAAWDFVAQGPATLVNPHLRLEVGIAAVLTYSSFHFYLAAQRRSSPAFYLLCLSLAFWAVLMLLGQYRPGLSEMFGVSGQLGPVW